MFDRLLDRFQGVLNPAAVAAKARRVPEVLNRGRIEWGSESVQGGRTTMEDRMTVIPNFVAMRGEEFGLAAVFDGHGGVEVAEKANKGLPEILARSFADGGNMEGALWGALYGLGIEMKNYHDGSTAVAALISERKLYLAYVGDSRAMILRDGVAYEVSVLHTPGSIAERERIEKWGGTVRRMGKIMRVGARGLAVSRALGDAGTQGISYQPDVYECDLLPGYQVLLMCDGVWKEFSPQNLATMGEQYPGPVALAKKLVEFASARGSGDNLTAIVAKVS